MSIQNKSRVIFNQGQETVETPMVHRSGVCGGTRHPWAKEACHLDHPPPLNLIQKSL